MTPHNQPGVALSFPASSREKGRERQTDRQKERGERERVCVCVCEHLCLTQTHTDTHTHTHTHRHTDTQTHRHTDRHTHHLTPPSLSPSLSFGLLLLFSNFFVFQNESWWGSSTRPRGRGWWDAGDPCATARAAGCVCVFVRALRRHRLAPGSHQAMCANTNVFISGGWVCSHAVQSKEKKLQRSSEMGRGGARRTERMRACRVQGGTKQS